MSNPKFYKKISDATSKLISCLTTFPESSENHEACKTYALSHFQNHRFLDVDSHKVERWIDGLCEKFIIHSKTDKERILRQLMTTFLSSPISKTAAEGSEIHYAVLSILLNLSKNPINKEYVKPVIVEKEVFDKFDWGKYLLEGEEILHPTQWACSDTPPSSDDEDLEDLNEIEHYGQVEPVGNPDKFREGDSSNEKLHLTKDLVSQYWNGKDICVNLTGFQIFSDSNISEINIMREVLWLLAGQRNLYIFPHLDGKHSVCDKLKTSHITPAAFKSALFRVANYGDIIQHLNNFVFNSQHTCQTYQAFAESLLHHIGIFKSRLTALERQITLHEETLTLSELIRILSPDLDELSQVFTVLKNSINLDNSHDTNAKKSSRFLGTLYNIILDQTDGVPQLGSHRMNSLVKMWVDSLRPYFEIVHNWMCFGTLIDPYDEFILRRPLDITVKSNNFWNEAIQLVSTECLQYLTWLRPVLDVIVVAGKSVEVLVSLGKNLGKDSDMNLHDIFSQKINQGVVNITKAEDKTNINWCQPRDELLQLNFERIFKDYQKRENTETFAVSSRVPFNVQIDRAFGDAIHDKSQIADKTLLDIFLEEHQFLFLLKCFHKFHLMEWGDVMYDFTTSIFQKISCGEYWEDLMSLRASLQEAVSESAADMDYSFVTVATNRSKQKRNESKQLIHSTDVIEMLFTVKWPLNIIITDSCIESYNNLFSYLMQIKHALYCLENIKFEMVTPELKVTQDIHRLSLLRAKLLSLLSHWHNFVMTSIIQSEKEAFLSQIACAKNVDSIRKAHAKSLNRILTLCLLKETRQADKIIQGTLRKIFNLSIILHMKWNKSNISHEGVRKFEAEYKECSEFLGTILQNLVSRGAVPLGLESLAFYLIK